MYPMAVILNVFTARQNGKVVFNPILQNTIPWLCFPVDGLWHRGVFFGLV